MHTPSREPPVNTHFADLDLVFRRIPEDSSGLTDIEFADMEPLDGSDLVGVMPLEAIAVIPYEAFDLVGVEGHAAVATTPVPRATAPFDREVLRPEDLQTEEFAAWG